MSLRVKLEASVTDVDVVADVTRVDGG